MNQEAWLNRHPYLRRLAQFRAQVELAAVDLPTSAAAIPHWDGYVCDFERGVPLLRSRGAAIRLEPAEEMIVSFIENMASRPLPNGLTDESRTLAAQIRRARDHYHVVESLLGECEFAPRNAGLLHYLGWTALSRYLRSIVEAFGSWREEERWLRSFCPTCGSFPNMAQLVGNEPERLRLLSCSYCGTRWRYRRIACPFCENGGEHRLEAITIEGEACLRIDYCSLCRGYLKTYVGQGDESLFLADWTSLHLDIIASDRGLRRLAASLYEL